jgi:hypothetical protein
MRRILVGIVVAMVVVGLGQIEASGQEGGQRPRGKAKNSKVTVKLIVDGDVRHQWSGTELRALATETWKNKSGVSHPAVSVWSLVESQGLGRKDVAEVRVRSTQGKERVFAGDELPRLDGMMFRTGRQRDFWQLVPAEVTKTSEREVLNNVSAIEVAIRKP